MQMHPASAPRADADGTRPRGPGIGQVGPKVPRGGYRWVAKIEIRG